MYENNIFQNKISKEDLCTHIANIRSANPVIHCITNVVTVNDCANILLAIGASPIMAQDIHESAEVTSIAAALVCNLGAINAFDSMKASSQEAGRLGIPVVLDPVGITASTFRRNFCISLLQSHMVSAIRCNLSEMYSLINGTHNIGLDSPESIRSQESTSHIIEDVMSFARKYNIVAAVTGQNDIVTDGKTVYLIDGGDPMIKRITGGGCMSSVIMAAFLADKAADTLTSAARSCTFMRLMAKEAANQTIHKEGGTMTFRNELIDACSKFND